MLKRNQLPMLARLFYQDISRVFDQNLSMIERQKRESLKSEELHRYETYCHIHVGEPIITVDRDTGEISLAKITGVFKFDPDSASQTIPTIHCYSDDPSTDDQACFMARKPYTQARFSALCKLSPYDRVAVFWDNLTPPESLKGVENTQSEQEILDIANKNGFAECLEEYKYF